MWTVAQVQSVYIYINVQIRGVYLCKTALPIVRYLPGVPLISVWTVITSDLVIMSCSIAYCKKLQPSLSCGTNVLFHPRVLKGCSMIDRQRLLRKPLTSELQCAVHFLSRLSYIQRHCFLLMSSPGWAAEILDEGGVERASCVTVAKVVACLRLLVAVSHPRNI